MLYALRRVAAGAGLVVVVATIVFFCTSVLPGDAAVQRLGRDANPQALTILRKQLGLDRPPQDRFIHWANGLVHGDFGTSLAGDAPVSTLIRSRIVNTLELAFITMMLLVPIAFTVGTISGLRPDGYFDRLTSWLSLAAISVPEFVVATLLALVFAVKLGWVPPVSLLPPGESAFSHLNLLVLPVITLLLIGLAYSIRMVRASVIEVMSAEYVEMARLNGVPEWRVITKHGLRNGLATVVQVIALTLQWFIGGVIVVETIFNYPGIGASLVDAVIARDTPYVQAVALLIAIMYIAINIIADILVILLVPRLRTSV